MALVQCVSVARTQILCGLLPWTYPHIGTGVCTLNFSFVVRPVVARSREFSCPGPKPERRLGGDSWLGQARGPIPVAGPQQGGRQRRLEGGRETVLLPK